MSNDRSDYNKHRFNINSFLPTHLRNELSASLFENLHNRFLSKDEAAFQRGTIGTPSTSATDRFPESSIFRQAYQLQPHVSIDVDSNTELMGWQDVLNQLTRLGVDTQKINDWGSTEQFNFGPPINPDKLINYRDYYWVGSTEPEYITIQNLATVYEAVDVELRNQLSAAQSTTPIDQQLIDEIQFQVVLNYTKLQFANNESIGWDLGYFDDNGGLHASVSAPSYTIDFGVALSSALRFRLNGDIIVPVDVTGSLVTFGVELHPGDDITVNVPWFYGVNPGPVAPVDQYAWFNTVDGLLYRYDTTSANWNVVTPQPNNDEGFDQLLSRSVSERQWTSTNMWKHKNFVERTTDIHQAQIPIIEYNHGLKLNEYMQVRYHWKYRALPTDPFVSVDVEPSALELSTRFPVTNQSPILDQFLRINGDVTSTFIHGLVFSVEGTNYPYQAIQLTVQESVYSDGTTSVYVTTPIDISVPTPSVLVPISTTSIGDKYLGLHVHWLLDYVDRPIPSDVDVPYSSTSNQQSFIVGQDASTSINARYDTARGDWQYTLPDLPSWCINGAQVYDPETTQLMTIELTGSNTFTILTIDGNEFVGYDGQYHTFLTSTYILSAGLEFLGGSNILRVYRNGLRQVDNYIEYLVTSDQSSPAEFLQRGNAVKFVSNLPTVGDVIYVESHVVYAGDVGRELVGVRRSESDVYELEQRSLVRFFRTEQIKYTTNQYPMFDLFDHNLQHTGQISPIWSFEESADFPPNKLVGGRRIRVSNQRRVYHFVNDLVDDNNKLLLYKRSTNGNYQYKTVWEYSKVYVPSLVNRDRQHDGDVVEDQYGNVVTITVDGDNGVGELPAQMFYNPSHECRRLYSTTDIFAHYNTIINQQQTSIGTIVDFDYTSGGAIKEHNYAFDDWLSSMFASKASTVDIIEFAKHQYIDFLAFVKRYVIAAYGNMSASTMINEEDKRKQIESDIISYITNDTWYARVYGDSDSYNGTYGIRNVIDTISRLGLWPTFRPSLSYDVKRQVSSIATHVGGSFDLTVSQIDSNKIVQQILNSTNVVVSTNVPPISAIGVGQYWYNSATRALYRYTPSFQQDIVPIASGIGQIWINTQTLTYNVWDGTDWIDLGTVIPSNCFVPFTVDSFLPSIVLAIENKLFQVSAVSNTEQKYDYTELLASDDRVTLYNQYLRDSFYEYCKRSQLDAFTNTTHKIVDPFTWNYRSAVPSLINYPNQSSVGNWAGHTNGIYNALFGTPYPHLEPWKLQGYSSKPTWWNDIYASGAGRRWNYDHDTGVGMWANIMNGVVPAGARYPSGQISSGNPVFDGVTLPSYTFVPVNITNNTIGSYLSDDLLPVYISDPLLVQYAVIRDQLAIDMTSIGDDWQFGDYAPVETSWRRSIDFIYDQAIIAYRIDPIKFLFRACGRVYREVDGLHIDQQTGRVCNHQDTSFHGQFLPESNQPTVVLGINQWYANYFRFHDVDVTTSNLYTKWTEWDMQCVYNTGSVVDNKSVDIFTDRGKLTTDDFSVVLKQSTGVHVVNVDNLIVNTVDVGTYTIAYNAKVPRGYGDNWTYRISTSSPIPKQFEYYGVKKYQARYQSNSTFMFMTEHRMVTGDLVRLQSSSTLPVPLNTFDDYYIIVSQTGFQLAHNKQHAISGIAVEIISGTDDIFDIGVVRSTFVPLNGAHTGLTWTTFEPDTSNVLTTQLPIELLGVQSVIDFVVGYSSRLSDVGVSFNTEMSINTDPVTGTAWTWDLELERLVDQIYIGLGTASSGLNQRSDSLSKDAIELNPFRLQCVVSPTVGVIGNVFDRNPSYLRGDPLIYDQVGNFFNSDQLFVLRRDTETLIKLDTNKIPQIDPLQSLHIGGMRLLTNQFEHVIAFKRGATSQGTIYDPHLGAEIKSLFVALEKNPNVTGRANLGGYFLSNGQLTENIEKTASNSSLFYDAYSSDEYAGYPEYARALIGYTSPDYLDDLKLTNKTKFNFWRGMIQAKGTKRAVSALTGAQQLADIEIDEFWAYRKARFGSSVSKIGTLDVRVNTTDVSYGRLRLSFPVGNETIHDLPYVTVTNDVGGRFDDYVNKRNLLDTIQNFYIEPEFTDVTTNVIKKTNQIQSDGSIKDVFYINTDVPYDAFVVNVTRDTSLIGTYTNNVYVSPSSEYTLVSVPLSTSILVGRGEANVKINGVVAQVNVDYVESPSTIYVKVRSSGSTTWVSINVEVTIGNLQLISGTDLIPLNSTTSRINYDLTGKTFTAYGIRPDYKRANTVEIVDTVSGIITSRVPIVMPHHNQYNANAMLNVSDMAINDPAIYTQSLTDDNVNAQSRWGTDKEGTVWFDTHSLLTTDFHDHILQPDVDKRLDNWGAQIPDASVIGYRWVSSPVVPANWVSYSESYDDPNGIIKPSGIPMVNLYYRTRPDTDTAFGSWIQINGEQTFKSTFAAMVTDLTSPTIDNPFVVDTMVSTTVEVFINGLYRGNASMDTVTQKIELPVVPQESDTVTIRLVVPEWRIFASDPVNYQPINGNTDLIEYQAYTPHSITTEYIGTGEFVESVNLYHFWVSDSNDIINTSKGTLKQVTQQFNKPVDTFAVVTDLIHDAAFTNLSKYKYTSVVLSGIDPVIASDNRYAIRLTVNDSIAIADNKIRSKVHYEWEMFREKQSYTIPTYLWNKLTESILGFKLDDINQPIPSDNRNFYDQQYNTNTRYGIRWDQSLGDKSDLINTINAVISDPTTDTYPVDKDNFFDKYSFDTTEDIIATMDYIMKYFPVAVVNKIMMETLTDLMVLAPNNPDILKTSWISVSGKTMVEIQ